MTKKLFVFVLATFSVLQVFAQQIKIPPASPVTEIKQAFGLGEVGLKYSRPSTKGRIIFGDLVPFDQLWRTGANASTKFWTTQEIEMEGRTIPAGYYSLYTIPGKMEWTVVIHRDTSLWGDEGYKQENDLVRFSIKPIILPYKIETFSINFSNLSMTECNMELAWENVLLPIKLRTDVDSKIEAAIASVLNPGPIANNYFTAASYYYDTGKDLNKALEWATAASSMRPTAYWMSHLKAKIEFRLANYTAAIETANKSMEQAQAQNANDYVRMNEKLIADSKTKSTAPSTTTTKPGAKPTAKPANGSIKPASTAGKNNTTTTKKN